MSDEVLTILTETYDECIPTTLTAREIMALMVARLMRVGIPQAKAVKYVREFMNS